MKKMMTKTTRMTTMIELNADDNEDDDERVG